jgi:hypothetical protein
MAEFDPRLLKEIGGIFRFGRGALGRSAVVIVVLIVAVIVGALRAKSDIAIISALLIGVAIFLIWFFRVLQFAEKHPDIALLEGGEWTGWKRFEARTKSIEHLSFEEQLPSSDVSIPELPTALRAKIEEPDR